MAIPREVMERIHAKLDPAAGVTKVAYCTRGHGFVDVETVEGESHGACPGLVIVLEHNPDAEVEVIPGGLTREAPPCAVCGQTTLLRFDDPADSSEVAKVEVHPLGKDPDAGQGRPEEWSFGLRDADGTEMTVCVRCMSAALAALPTPITLREVRGRTVPWRREDG